MLHSACILLGLGLVAGTGLPKPVPDRAPTQTAGFPAPIVQQAVDDQPDA